MFSLNLSVPIVGMRPSNSPLALFFADIRNFSLWKSINSQSLSMVYLITMSVNLTAEYRTIEYFNKKLIGEKVV
jgi:hypothetical protein